MCMISSGQQCGCSTRSTGSGAGVILVLTVTLAAVWWLIRAAVLVAILTGLWLSGAQVIRRRTRIRVWSRPVHAAGRVALAGLTVAGVMWPLPTGIAAGVAVPALVAASVVSRRRDRNRSALAAAVPRPPLRVAASTGWPERRRGEHQRARTHGGGTR